MIKVTASSRGETWQRGVTSSREDDVIDALNTCSSKLVTTRMLLHSECVNAATMINRQHGTQ
ncbi:hypothetical protein E2C01_029240 [Portunus trituberculatus]|uniref:Uncharacterized protein n=1 Tax=Portunus trituberculatus TaxID=210409 RepID=A0A5B7EU42_PORTR|nr:hypothetical protein [Portunus trituberculatus]